MYLDLSRDTSSFADSLGFQGVQRASMIDLVHNSSIFGMIGVGFDLSPPSCLSNTASNYLVMLPPCSCFPQLCHAVRSDAEPRDILSSVVRAVRDSDNCSWIRQHGLFRQALVLRFHHGSLV